MSFRLSRAIRESNENFLIIDSDQINRRRKYFYQILNNNIAYGMTIYMQLYKYKRDSYI